MTSTDSGAAEGQDGPDLARLASDWIALWQGELAALSADPELTAAWSRAMAAWTHGWSESARPGGAPSMNWPMNWPAGPWQAPGWPLPPGWPPAPFATPAPPRPEPSREPPPRPAPPAGASDPGAQPGLAGNGLDPLIARLENLERELAGLRATLAAGEGRARPDPAKPRRR